ncbi:MAG TPA: MarR family transcriptional regulator [Bacillota bacterium]|jgi:DNA-binding MarR family transcriptional regulator
MSESLGEIGELLRSVNRAIHDRFRQAFQGCELHPGAMFMLRHISQEPGLTVGELAKRAGTAKSHVSKMMEQLVQQGYVEKRADPTDQRLVRIHVTRAAAENLSEMEERAREAWAGVVREIPQGQMEQVVRGLRILLTALEKANRGSKD